VRSDGGVSQALRPLCVLAAKMKDTDASKPVIARFKRLIARGLLQHRGVVVPGVVPPMPVPVAANDSTSEGRSGGDGSPSPSAVSHRLTIATANPFLGQDLSSARTHASASKPTAGSTPSHRNKNMGLLSPGHKSKSFRLRAGGSPLSGAHPSGRSSELGVSHATRRSTDAAGAGAGEGSGGGEGSGAAASAVPSPKRRRRRHRRQPSDKRHRRARKRAGSRASSASSADDTGGVHADVLALVESGEVNVPAKRGRRRARNQRRMGSSGSHSRSGSVDAASQEAAEGRR